VSVKDGWVCAVTSETAHKSIYMTNKLTVSSSAENLEDDPLAIVENEESLVKPERGAVIVSRRGISIDFRGGLSVKLGGTETL
jgi:hypothetical protein